VSAHSKAGLSSLLALILCAMTALGAPPSEFVQEPSIWLRLEPLISLALFSGAMLALLALMFSPFWARAAAVACAGAAAASMVGVLLAWSIDAEANPRRLLLPIGLLALPAIGAVDALRQVRREQRATGEGSMEERAG
jgi:hypothetical protein